MTQSSPSTTFLVLHIIFSALGTTDPRHADCLTVVLFTSTAVCSVSHYLPLLLSCLLSLFLANECNQIKTTQQHRTAPHHNATQHSASPKESSSCPSRALWSKRPSNTRGRHLQVLPTTLVAVGTVAQEPWWNAHLQEPRCSSTSADTRACRPPLTRQGEENYKRAAQFSSALTHKNFAANNVTRYLVQFSSLVLKSTSGRRE